MSLKVTDVVSIRETTINKLNDVIKILSDLTTEYAKTDSLHELERIKKEYNAHLQYMATLYAKVKAFKGPNHTYLEREIKQIKAETLSLVMQEGVKVTQAENIVYSQPYYKDRMAIIHKLIECFIKVEALYDRFNTTLQCIVQSVSLGSKELTNSKIVSE